MVPPSPTGPQSLTLVLPAFDEADRIGPALDELFEYLRSSVGEGLPPRVDVLVVDDFAVSPVNDTQRSDLLEVLEDRYGSRSTIVTSQLPSAQWHDYLADPTLADAICDRLLNNAHRLVLKGPSRRKEQTQQT